MGKTGQAARVLLAWIGKTDLDAADGRLKNGSGPIAQAVEKRSFDSVVLLCDWDKGKGEAFTEWLGARTQASIVLRQVKLLTPTDYAGIYESARETVTWVRKEHGPATELSFHLSPGTSQMATMWVFLSATEPAELLQSSLEQGLQTVQVPFRIAAEYTPAIADDAFERLAAGVRPDDPSFDDLLHGSAAMKELVAKAKLTVGYSAPLLIEGESGTGKEILAAAIHKATKRRGKFVPVNCGAIPKELVESEFFGHKRGAFTGATDDRRGHFEQAKGGTLFLDEIGELPLTMQVKLLRAIQEKKIVRVGESQAIDVDVRIVSATNRDLATEVDQGRFREDLYYRLAVLALRMPPLRERQGDITLLAEHLLQKQQEHLSNALLRKKLSAGAKNVLLRHSWPGNVRELEATLLRALVWSASATISEAEMKKAVVLRGTAAKESVLGRPLGDSLDLPQIAREVARHYLERALAETRGNKTKAAKLVGLKSQQTFTNWMQRHGVKEWKS